MPVRREQLELEDRRPAVEGVGAAVDLGDERAQAAPSRARRRPRPRQRGASPGSAGRRPSTQRSTGSRSSISARASRLRSVSRRGGAGRAVADPQVARARSPTSGATRSGSGRPAEIDLVERRDRSGGRSSAARPSVAGRGDPPQLVGAVDRAPRTSASGRRPRRGSAAPSPGTMSLFIVEPGIRSWAPVRFRPPPGGRRVGAVRRDQPDVDPVEVLRQVAAERGDRPSRPAARPGEEDRRHRRSAGSRSPAVDGDRRRGASRGSRSWSRRRFVVKAIRRPSGDQAGVADPGRLVGQPPRRAGRERRRARAGRSRGRRTRRRSNR